ncbi:hypothetical protein Hypma_001390 [Hypsizygus marmoreus]|uniref:F-box domain-containing protein n=1 Tax=Hypsizygus marmoreus TaxID=39966 RepID=A0A369KB31_HYPMA|nr:hypothetical protein Hypma_001390 [Hypsizygus marmoreus]
MANFGPRTPSTESSTCSAEGSEHASSLRRSFSRSRSPIPRLKQLFSLKSPPPSFASLESFANAPPIEVIINVGRHLSSPRDVLSVSLTCRQARAALLPRLYNTVELRSNKACRSALEAFSKRSEITQHIQTLTVRPNNTERTPSGEHLDELLVSNLIIVIASRLPSLHSFYWDGLEMPDDKLWLALRKFCPRLKCIGTSVGTLPLDTSDALFDFRDLLKFSFTVRCDSLTWLTEGRPSVEKLPRRLWQMLLERCPGLTELTIGGSAPSPRLFDTRHVMAGRWPRLRKLTLGETIILHASQDENAPETQALNKFLAAHPTLREIAFQHPGTYGYPDSLLLPQNALPRVESFSGPPRYVRALTHPARLKSLAITTLHHCPSAFPPTCAILHGFPSLTSLSIWIDLSFARRNPLHDGGNIFRTILECCPRLIHFDVSCFTRPTFHVKEFSAALTRSPQLRSFSLTKIHKQSDEDMNQTAMRIAHDNPNIQKFSLRYSLDTWLTHSTGRIKQFGDYEVLTRPDGLPGSMVGYEWGVRTFGSPYSRHYVQDLRPPRSKQASRSSWSSPLEQPQSPRPQSVLSVQPSVSHSVHWQPSVSHSVHWH